MADNDLFSASINHNSFDDEGLETLPLITKERTQRFELLLHLIPNLKQHIILCGASGIGKTLLLDMLYDLDSDVWQCCFVQGNAELSFEMIEAQLTKTMLRNKHESLDSALHTFKEQHKKIVLIIDDAGLLVSGLMTTLIDYAASQPALKLIFSLTPETRNNHRKTDKALDNCYLLELPTLSKRQCASFLRHLAAKPRTYGSIPIDEKLVDKIYQDTHGIPARVMADFTKLSRKNENDYTKWVAAFVGLVVLAMAINQGVRYFKKDEPIEDTPVLPVEKIEQAPKPIAPVEKTPPVSTTEPQIKNDTDIVPEFKLDIEKAVAPAPTTPPVETTPVEKIPENPEPSVEKAPEPVSTPVVEPEKSAVPVQAEPEKVTPSVEKTPEPTQPVAKPETIAPAPVVSEPVKPVAPMVAFPKVEPAKGMKIQPLAEKPTVQAVPIPAPEVKTVKIEPAKKIEIKPVEKPAEVKKPEPVKVEPVKKIEPKPVKEKTEKTVEKEKIETVVPPAAGRYTLQLITLSSPAAVENFKKKHPSLAKNFRIVKSGTEEQPRFGLMYGGFANADEAAQARKNLPSEFASALPRKLNP